MRKYITIALVLLSTLNLFSKDVHEDSLRYYFDSLYNSYRIEKGLTAVRIVSNHDILCIWNNDRMSKNDTVLKREYKTNKKFREIAHDGYTERLSKYFESVKEYDYIKKGENLPHGFTEMVSFVPLLDTNDIYQKELTNLEEANYILFLFQYSKDHNEGLLFNDVIDYSIRIKIVIIGNKRGYSTTMIIKTKNPSF